MASAFVARAGCLKGCCRPRCCLCKLGHLPVQSGGIALNLVATAGLLDTLSNTHPQHRWLLQPVHSVLMSESLLLQTICLVRMLCLFEFAHGMWRSTLLYEISSRRVISSHSALLFSIQLLGSQLYRYSEAHEYGLGGLICGVIYASVAMNCGLNLLFLVLCLLRRQPVEPFWFPATVSVAGLAVIGKVIGAPTWLTYASLGAGCVFTAVLWPLCAYRVLWYSRVVAPDPSVFILMAPIPFVTIAMFACRPHPNEPLLGPVGKNIFFVLNTVNVILAFVCAFQRRSALRRTLWPMSPLWASITFPLASNCSVAIFYANEYSAQRTDSWATIASTYWARVLIPLTLVIIPVVDLLWMVHLPNWFCFNPPTRSPSIGRFYVSSDVPRDDGRSSDVASSLAMENCRTGVLSQICVELQENVHASSNTRHPGGDDMTAERPIALSTSRDNLLEQTGRSPGSDLEV
ncbi:hypothetical protein AB1Y20_004600 [Prymnesium parvum]|uniref:Mannosyltransferase n=1 Tax=Prymnesium parvum TaxID=97485 RepID=A0AB34IY12_PRYPA